MGREFDAETRASLLAVNREEGDKQRSFDERAKKAMRNLEKCEQQLNTRRHQWRKRLNDLWGPEPPYKLQPEDAASWICGQLYYTWIGDLMFRAAREELSEEEMPGPTRMSRAYNSGLMLSRVLQQQRFQRRVWDAYIGVEVRHRRDRDSAGELRWVGYAQQKRTPRQLYAGVEWRVPPTHRLKEENRNASRSPFTNGVVEGEYLFNTSSGNDTATCEHVDDIVIHCPLPERKRRQGGMPVTTQKRPKPMSVARALFSALGYHVYVLIPFRLLRDTCQLAVPVVLQYYIEYIETADPSWRDGLLLVLAFSLLTLVQSAAGSKLTQLGWRSGYTFQNALQGVLFEKCGTILRKALSHPEMSVGRIVNMVSSDMNSARSFPLMLPFLFGAPLQLIFALALLYRLVGWCAFAGFGVLILFMPLQGILMRRYYAVYGRLSRATDARLKATNEFFSGVRIAKFMSWEPSFIRRIEERRREELAALRASQLLYVSVSFLTNAIPAFVVAVVFLLYIELGHELTPAIVFPAIALLGIMQTPFVMIPVALSGLVRFVVSMRRITKFIECEDADDGMREMLLQHTANSQAIPEEIKDLMHKPMMASVAAEFIRATISTFVPQKLPPNAKELRAAQKKKRPDGAEPTSSSQYYELRPKDLLHGITLRIPKGKLTCVVGDTGSGKSTLIESLLGDHEVTSGFLRSVPNIAYVPQQAWIMNATLKENILFFSDMDEARFRRALRCTQLESDLKLLLNGVETEIGEKGVNLSGGQKARVSLARAVYATGRELYLLDDPLSALDAHVGEHVMHECILGELRSTTRMLVTHQLHQLRYADHIILLQEGGTVAFAGSYEDYGRFIAGREATPIVATAAEAAAAAASSSVEGGEAVGELQAPKSEITGVNNGDDENSDNDLSHNASTLLFYEDEDNEEQSQQQQQNKKKKEDGSTDEKNMDGKLMTDEEKAVGAVSLLTYVKYMETCGGATLCGLVFLLFIVTEFLLVSPSLWLSFWSVKRFELEPKTYLLLYVAFVAASALCSPLRNASAYAVLRIGSWRLHSQLLRSVAVAPMSFFDTTPLGRVMNRFSKDMSTIDSNLQSSVIFFLQSILSVISSIVVMSISQYFVLIAIIPCLLVYYRLMVFYNSANREMRRIANRSNSPVFSVLGEMLSGRWTIAAYDRTAAFVAKALRRIDTVYACSYMQTVCDCWLAVRIEILSNVVLTSVALVGVLLVMLRFGHVDVGLLALSLTMAVSINSQLKYVVNQAASVEADMNCVERVQHYTSNIEHEDLMEEINEAIRALEKNDKKRRKREGDHITPAGITHDDDDTSTATVSVPLLQESHASVASPELPFSPAGNNNHNDDDGTRENVAAGSLEFRDVTMRYRAGLPHVLCGLTFTIPAGQKVGVIGRTGSGKSSLLLTLLRVVDIEDGQIVLSGRPIRSYSLRALRQLFSMIPQDPLLFNGKVRENLDPLNVCSDAQVREAIRLVGMEDRLAAETDPLQCPVEEGGANFSVGQRQLLCMARTLLRRGCSFILMDEATANVDPTLDKQIQHVVTHVFAGHTVITIAHRLHTLATYDVILMMEEGRVVEMGSPYDLVRSADTRFAQMVRSLGESAMQEFMASTQAPTR
ncbi:ATP-binding cassette protein subfamily C, member 1 [Trypanosoma cruzi]|nr:ATP-binding cassette protein subfamily C, member 1 [Trypanosoma cruzi]